RGARTNHLGRDLCSGGPSVFNSHRPGQIRTSYANRSAGARAWPNLWKVFQRNAMKSSNALSSGHPETHRRRGTSQMRWAFACFNARDHEARIVLCLVRVISSEIARFLPSLGMTRLRNGV